MISHVRVDPAFCFMLAAIFVIHLTADVARITKMAALAVAIALFPFGVWLNHGFGNFWETTVSFGLFLGTASLLVLTWNVLWTRGPGHKKALTTFYAAVAFPAAWMVIWFNLLFTQRLYPQTYDLSLYRLDSSLGFQPSFVLGNLAESNPLITYFTLLIYTSIPLAVGCSYGQYRRRESQPVKLVFLLAGALLVGYALYALYPAAGPRFAFGHAFPARAPALNQLITDPGLALAPRNCVPSLHFAIALLVFWNTRGARRLWRAVALLYLCAIAFATLATGQHYAVDLVIAFPFALVLQAIWTTILSLRSAERTGAIIAGIVTYCIWMAVLYRGISLMITMPALFYSLIIATIILCILLENRLARAGELAARKCLRLEASPSEVLART